MSEILKYDFQVTGQKRDLDLNHLEEQFTIVASEKDLRISDFYFFLKLKKDSSTFEVKKISIASDVSPSWQVSKVLSYIEGKFRFRDEKEVEQSLIELQKAFNNQQCCIDIFDHSWRMFHRQFVEWFSNELQPFLENEIKSYQQFINLNTRSE